MDKVKQKFLAAAKAAKGFAAKAVAALTPFAKKVSSAAKFTATEFYFAGKRSFLAALNKSVSVDFDLDVRSIKVLERVARSTNHSVDSVVVILLANFLEENKKATKKATKKHGKARRK